MSTHQLWSRCRVWIGLAALLLAGCAHSLDGVQQALSAAEQLQTAAIRSFEAFDQTHQMEIVMTAANLSDGEAKLADYRKRRARVLTAALALGAITTTARATLAMVQAGRAKPSALDQLLSSVASTVGQLEQAIAAAEGK